jgi:hypothetical protein
MLYLVKSSAGPKANGFSNAYRVRAILGASSNSQRGEGVYPERDSRIDADASDGVTAASA